MTAANRLPRGGRRAHLLALEPRMMFDAAAAATAEAVVARAHDIFDRTDHAVGESHDRAVAAHAGTDGPAPAARTPDAPAAGGRELIFIDTSVPDYRQLAARWAGRGEVVLIDSRADGLAQIEAALAASHDVSAIHIVSHGEEGALFLGTTRIDRTAIDGALKGDLAAIGAAIAPGGDILLYGCDFAEGADGAAALHDLALATGRDVAASTDVTGASDLGGDWTLEAREGTIQARTLDAAGWEHALAANAAVPITVTADSLTVKDAGGNTVVSGSSGYTNDYSPALTQAGATAVWANAATYKGQALDLKATVVSLSSGDQIQFYRPGTGKTDPTAATFIITDNTSGDTDATVSILWQLVVHGTDTAAPANVEFTIGDIDGIDGAKTFPSRESVSTSTDNLAYYTREGTTDIHFDPSLSQVIASGTKNENTDADAAENTASNATFDWTNVTGFTLNYRLTANNGAATRAQFYHDGNATLAYSDPRYVSIPRLDLDGNDSTATGADARLAYRENQAPIAVVDQDVVVTNPMPSSGVLSADVVLTNAKAGDVLAVGTLPAGITATIDNSVAGRISVHLSGAGDEATYQAALKAVTYASTSDNPDTAQRDIAITFSNDTLTSNVAHSRIDVTRVNDAPAPSGSLPDRSAQDAAAVSYPTASGFGDPDGDTLTYSATGLPAGLSIDAATGVISGTIDHSASQAGGGRYTVSVKATDPSNASATQSFTITVANPPPVARDDAASTPEATPVTVAVLGNDSDPDGDPLTVTAASASHGSVVRNAGGTITYTPDAHFVGSDTIAYTISDGQGGTSNATVAVTVTDVPPTANGTLPARSTLDAATVSYATAGGFADANGDTLTYSATGLPAGLAIDATTGVISGTVDRSASQAGGGAYTVVVTATDPAGGHATQSFALSVANPPPVARDDTATTAEDRAVTIAVLGNDSDPDGDPLTVTAASASHGSVVRNADGTITYTPDADFNGSDTIAYTISDGQGGTADAVVKVTVTPVNDAPTTPATLPDRSTSDGAAVSWTTAGAFADPDGDALTYSATGLPAGLSIDAATGVISGTVDRSASQSGAGRYTVTVKATDPSNASATRSFAVDVANPPPVAADDRASTHGGTPVTVAVLANDRDPDGDPLTVTAASASHGSVVRNADGTITYTPTGGFRGTDTIDYTISDGQGGTSGATVSVTVDDHAPTATPIAAQAARDGEPVSLDAARAFSDPDGDALTYSATGLPPGLAIDRTTGAITGTIGRSASQADGGVYDTVVTADDGHGGMATTTIHWTVANPAPQAAGDEAATDQGVPVVIAPLANDVDPDGDPLSVSAATAAHGTVAVNPDGTITYTPDAGFFGTDTIRYTASDGEGGATDAAIAVTVRHVDRAPTAAGLPPRTAAEGSPVSAPLADAFADADGDALTYATAGLPAGLAIDPATGIVSGTPTAGDATGGPAGDGRYPVTVTATDPAGRSASTSFVWTVTPAGPVARADSAATAAGTPVVIDVLANDGDAGGLALTLTAVTARHGSATIADGRIVFTPEPGYAGPALVTYTVTDAAGRSATADATVTVVAGDRAPTTRAIPAAAGRDGQAGVSLDVGSAFADPDGDRLTFAATGLPAGLAIDPATGRITGTIDHRASQANGGVYRVTVTATDPAGLSIDQGFDWTIANPAPIARGDTATTRADTPVAIAVLANDGDPDGDQLRVTGAQAGHGTVSVRQDGTLTYTPAQGFAGTDTIAYAISDGDGGSAAASVQVLVIRDLPPVIAPHAPVNAVAGRPVTLQPLAGATDPDGDPLAVTAVTAVSTAVGTARINPDNSVTFTPDRGFVGTTSVTFTVGDGRGGTATGTIVVRVAAEPTADVQQLLAIGRGISPAWQGPREPGDAPRFAGAAVPGLSVGNPILLPGGIGRAPFPVAAILGMIRPLDGTRDLSTATPVGDAVEGARSLDGIGESEANGSGYAITNEVARLQRLGDFRDAAARLFGHRWQDVGHAPLAGFGADGLTGFSIAGADGCVMIETLVDGGAIYLDVRDTAPDAAAAIRSINVTDATGARPDWLTVDRRGFAIVEADALTDEVRLAVTVIRADGSRSTTPVVIQRATGEIEVDRQRPAVRARAAPRLDATLHTPDAAHRAAAADLHRIFR